MEDDLEDEQELIEAKLLVDMVIDRLIRHVSSNGEREKERGRVIVIYFNYISLCQDHVLLEVHEEGEEMEVDKESIKDPYLMVHPNYVIET